MQWDLGLGAVTVLAAMSLGFGVVAGALAGRTTHRLRVGLVTAGACFVMGLVTSEVWFGWATGEDLQPNVDGLSFDEVLLACLVTSALVVAVARISARRAHRAVHH